MQMKLLQHQFQPKDDTCGSAAKRMSISEFEATFSSLESKILA